MLSCPLTMSLLPLFPWMFSNQGHPFSPEACGSLAITCSSNTKQFLRDCNLLEFNFLNHRQNDENEFIPSEWNQVNKLNVIEMNLCGTHT